MNGIGPGAAALCGAGLLLLGWSSLSRGESQEAVPRGAGPLAFLALALALVLATLELTAGRGDLVGPLGRALVAAGCLGTLLLGEARGGLPLQATGLLLLAAAGLDLAVSAARLEWLALGWGVGLVGTLGAARAAGWVAPAGRRLLLLETGAGLLLFLAGALTLRTGLGTSELARMAFPVAGGDGAGAARLGPLLCGLALLLPLGKLSAWRDAADAPAFLAWTAGPLAAAGALLAARLLLPLAQAGADAGGWRELVAWAGLIVIAAGGGAALRARTLPGLMSGAARAQAGWLFLALAALTPAPAPGRGWDLALAGTALGWQALGAVAAILGGFACCALVEEAWGEASLARVTGLARRNGWLAAWLLVPLLALAGLPPGAAFPGRVALLGAAGAALPGWVGLAAALLLLPGLLLALRVARVTLHGGRPGRAEEPLVAGAGLTLWAGSLALLSILLGLCPAGLERPLAALAVP